MTLEQRVVVTPTDGFLGPLLRIADDRLAPHAGYGRHAHRAVDVVAVVLAGSLRHRWGDGAELAAGDVAVLRAGAATDSPGAARASHRRASGRPRSTQPAAARCTSYAGPAAGSALRR